MRVTFPRLPDHEWSYAVIERDDGAVYRLYGGLAGAPLPRGARLLIVERSLGIRDGLWGGIAAGAVHLSMRQGRCGRPPRPCPRPPGPGREPRLAGSRAELLADLAERVAGMATPCPQQIRRLARAVLPAAPDGGPGIDPEAIAAAARALQVEAARWARLRPGQELTYEWPSPAPRASPGRASPGRASPGRANPGRASPGRASPNAHPGT
jgi:hypothetical protein